MRTLIIFTSHFQEKKLREIQKNNIKEIAKKKLIEDWKKMNKISFLKKKDLINVKINNQNSMQNLCDNWKCKGDVFLFDYNYKYRVQYLEYWISIKNVYPHSQSCLQKTILASIFQYKDIATTSQSINNK